MLSGYHQDSSRSEAVCHVSPVQRHEQQSMKSDSPQKKPRLGTDVDMQTPTEELKSEDSKRLYDNRDFSTDRSRAGDEDEAVEFPFQQLRISTHSQAVQDQDEINLIASCCPMFNQFFHGESQYMEAARFPGLYLNFATDKSDWLSEARVQAKEGISVILYCSRMLFILSHVKAV